MTTWYDEDYDDPEEDYYDGDGYYFDFEDDLDYYEEYRPVEASIKQRILWKLWNFWNYTLNMRRCPGCDKPYAFGNHDECIPF